MATVISLISYPFLPAKVGGQKGVALFNKYFSRYHHLICVTTRNNDPLAAEGYEVRNILSNSAIRYLNIFYFFTLRRIIRTEKASYLLIEHPYYGWLGILLKYLCRVKLIVHSHNIEGLRWKTLGKWWWWILWQYEKQTHHHADFNFFIHDQDREYAIRNFGLVANNCLTMTYGIEWESLPPAEEIKKCKEDIRHLYGIQDSETLLLFNGAFNYRPNVEALQAIIHQINPLLQEKTFPYRILICGKDIPPHISQGTYPNIQFAGFVEDISLYFKAADIFLNPLTEGGGIKTKLVEALGYNLNAVSTRNGAIGIPTSLCNGKLFITEDGDWEGFTDLVVKAAAYQADLPSGYFEYFYWGNSTKKAAEFIGDA